MDLDLDRMVSIDKTLEVKQDGNYWNGICFLNGYDHYPVNHKLAFKYFTLGANEDHIDSIVELGFCYLNGQGTIGDLGKAVKCFQRAYKYASLEAWTMVGFLTYNGNGIIQDKEEGLSILDTAIEMGSHTAYAMLSLLDDPEPPSQQDRVQLYSRPNWSSS